MSDRSTLWERVGQVGIPGLGDEQILLLTSEMLRDMNLAQLQVVVNDLHTQIEGQSLHHPLSSTVSPLVTVPTLIFLNPT